MKYLKRFNESLGEDDVDAIKYDIEDILTDLEESGWFISIGRSVRNLETNECGLIAHIRKSKPHKRLPSRFYVSRIEELRRMEDMMVGKFGEGNYKVQYNVKEHIMIGATKNHTIEGYQELLNWERRKNEGHKHYMGLEEIFALYTIPLK